MGPPPNNLNFHYYYVQAFDFRQKCNFLRRFFRDMFGKPNTCIENVLSCSGRCGKKQIGPGEQRHGKSVLPRRRNGGILSGYCRISTMLRFQRSLVGAVSLMVTTVPAGWTVAFCRCTQNVPRMPELLS